MNISNNTILITGGGSGIGLALAKEFLKHGNVVIICGRNANKLTKAKQQNPHLHTLVCDVSDEKSISEMIKAIRKDYPNLNMLINNAGVMHIHDVVNNSLALEHQKEEVMTNFYGVISLCDKLLPQLMKQKSSAILNISSGLVNMPFLAAPVYIATKAGVHSYTQSIRQALKDTSVTVFEVLPPVVDTELSRNIEMKVIAKMSPDKLAKIIIQRMKNGKVEIKPGAFAMIIKMYKLFPWLINTIVSKVARRTLTNIPKY